MIAHKPNAIVLSDVRKRRAIVTSLRASVLPSEGTILAAKLRVSIGARYGVVIEATSEMPVTARVDFQFFLSHWLACLTPQNLGGAQMPQSSKVPQPSSIVPHCAPKRSHVFGAQPHLFATPVPPQVLGVVQVPQCSVRPHPSGTSPQLSPSPMQVFGIHDPCRTCWGRHRRTSGWSGNRDTEACDCTRLESSRTQLGPHRSSACIRTCWACRWPHTKRARCRCRSRASRRNRHWPRRNQRRDQSTSSACTRRRWHHHLRRTSWAMGTRFRNRASIHTCRGSCRSFFPASCRWWVCTRSDWSCLLHRTCLAPGTGCRNRAPCRTRPTQSRTPRRDRCTLRIARLGSTTVGTVTAANIGSAAGLAVESPAAPIGDHAAVCVLRGAGGLCALALVGRPVPCTGLPGLGARSAIEHVPAAIGRHAAFRIDLWACERHTAAFLAHAAAAAGFGLDAATALHRASAGVGDLAAARAEIHATPRRARIVAGICCALHRRISQFRMSRSRVGRRNRQGPCRTRRAARCTCAEARRCVTCGSVSGRVGFRDLWLLFDLVPFEVVPARDRAARGRDNHRKDRPANH